MAQPRIGPQRAQQRVLQDVLGVLVAGQPARVRRAARRRGPRRGVQNGGSARSSHRCNARARRECEVATGAPPDARRRAARPPSRARACWRRRPTSASTPSTTATSRKPQKTETPGPMPPNGSATSLTMPQPSASRPTTIAITSRTPPTRAARPAPGGGAISPSAQHQQLAVRRRRAWPSFSAATFRSPGAALGERQRRLGHPPQLQALLRARGGDRGAEVLARALGVHALGRARAEDAPARRPGSGSPPPAPRRSGSRAAASRPERRL